MKNLLTTIGLGVVLTKGYALNREYGEMKRERETQRPTGNWDISKGKLPSSKQLIAQRHSIE